MKVRLWGSLSNRTLHCKVTEGIYIKYVKFKVLTAVGMKRTVFWDIKPWSPLKVNRRLWGIYRLHLQNGGISRARNESQKQVTRLALAFTLVSCWVFFILKLEEIFPSEISVDFQRTSSLFALQPCMGLGLLHWFRNSKFFPGWVVSPLPNSQPRGPGPINLSGSTLWPVCHGWPYQEPTLQPT
jgi:hypothetical protein